MCCSGGFSRNAWWFPAEQLCSAEHSLRNPGLGYILNPQQALQPAKPILYRACISNSEMRLWLFSLIKRLANFLMPIQHAISGAQTARCVSRDYYKSRRDVLQSRHAF